jgi:mono/diheme cytochrome c family protein
MAVHTPIGARHTGIPPWAIWLTVFVTLVGGVYLASNLAGENPALAVPGASVPASVPAGPGQAVAIMEGAVPACQSCHGQDLTGGVGPSLIGVAEGPKSENLQQLAADHPDDWIALWIAGTDPEVVEIDRMGMPPFGDQLSPEQIDSIVEYLKSL